MIKFTDEFIKEANYLYRLAAEISDLSISYLDELDDKLFIKRLNDIFMTRFNKSVHFLSNDYNKPAIISAIRNYLIGLGSLNENALVCAFIEDLNLI